MREASCFECGANYRIRAVSPDKAQWEPVQLEVACPSDGCDGRTWWWHDDVKVGTRSTCDSCSEEYVLVLGVNKVKSETG